MDLSRYLPLSNAAHHDESAVVSDRRSEIADLVREAARLAAARPTIADELAAQFARDARLTSGTCSAPTDLTRLAAQVQTGRRKRIRALVDAVRATFLLAHRVEVQPVVSDATLGVVALALVGSATLERRAVVSGHTIAATDAAWEFGHGAVLEGTARQIVEFLLGTSDEPPTLRERDGRTRRSEKGLPDLRARSCVS